MDDKLFCYLQALVFSVRNGPASQLATGMCAGCFVSSYKLQQPTDFQAPASNHQPNDQALEGNQADEGDSRHREMQVVSQRVGTFAAEIRGESTSSRRENPKTRTKCCGSGSFSTCSGNKHTRSHSWAITCFSFKRFH